MDSLYMKTNAGADVTVNITAEDDDGAFLQVHVALDDTGEELVDIIVTEEADADALLAAVTEAVAGFKKLAQK
jgi:hypothetical protein